jgi:hypothetical protein
VVWVGCIGYGRVPEVGKPNLLPGGQTETELMMMPFTKFVLAETINSLQQVPPGRGGGGGGDSAN